MPTRNVVLTEHQDRMIDRLVQGGRYQNASEILREGLRLLEAAEDDRAARLEALRAAVGAGMADFEQGRFDEFASADAMFDHLDALAEKSLPITRDP